MLKPQQSCGRARCKPQFRAGRLLLSGALHNALPSAATAPTLCHPGRSLACYRARAAAASSAHAAAGASLAAPAACAARAAASRLHSTPAHTRPLAACVRRGVTGAGQQRALKAGKGIGARSRARVKGIQVQGRGGRSRMWRPPAADAGTARQEQARAVVFIAWQHQEGGLGLSQVGGSARNRAQIAIPRPAAAGAAGNE